VAPQYEVHEQTVADRNLSMVRHLAPRKRGEPLGASHCHVREAVALFGVPPRRTKAKRAAGGSKNLRAARQSAARQCHKGDNASRERG